MDDYLLFTKEDYEQAHLWDLEDLQKEIDDKNREIDNKNEAIEKLTKQVQTLSGAVIRLVECINKSRPENDEIKDQLNEAMELVLDLHI